LNSLVYKQFNPILKRARSPNISLYDLRHTASTLALTVRDFAESGVGAIGAYQTAFTLDVYSLRAAEDAG
jgi:integrase